MIRFLLLHRIEWTDANPRLVMIYGGAMCLAVVALANLLLRAVP